LLVGVLREATGGYGGMFVLVLAGVVGLTVTGWLVTRARYVDDEVPGWSPSEGRADEPAVAAPTRMDLRAPDDGSPRG